MTSIHRCLSSSLGNDGTTGLATAADHRRCSHRLMRAGEDQSEMQMTSYLRLARHRLDDGTRDLLGKDIAEHVAATDLDPSTNESILARIGSHALSRYLPGEILRALQVFSASG